jgi:hypothetical protein
MQARSFVVVLALVGVVFGLALWRGRTHAPPVSPPTSSAALPSVSASAPAAASGMAAEPAPEPPSEPASGSRDGADLPVASAAAPTDASLPADAPRQVVFGVVLVEYRGAQTAPKTSRSRAEAEAKATELRQLAEKDFASAVKNGDKGSMENAGSMPRGILEPGPERVLFGLRVGEVGGPVDTPRGFWVLKRLE